MKKLIFFSVLVLILFLIPACKKGSPTTPEPPATTAQSIAVTSTNSMCYIGETETFTATVTMSDSTIKAITNGAWSSDNPNVATVDNNGVATIKRSGNANIIMTYSGRTGSKSIRGLPNYQGTWAGTYRIDSSSATGDFQKQGFRDVIPVGTILEIGLILTQTEDSVSGTFFLGTLSSTATGPIATDGKLTLSGKAGGGTTSIDVIFSLQSTNPGQITGKLNQLWTDTTMWGDGRFNCTIQSLTRTSSMAIASGIAGLPFMMNPTLQDLLRALTIR